MDQLIASLPQGEDYTVVTLTHIKYHIKHCVLPFGKPIYRYPDIYKLVSKFKSQHDRLSCIYLLRPYADMSWLTSCVWRLVTNKEERCGLFLNCSEFGTLNIDYLGEWVKRTIEDMSGSTNSQLVVANEFSRVCKSWNYFITYIIKPLSVPLRKTITELAILYKHPFVNSTPIMALSYVMSYFPGKPGIETLKRLLPVWKAPILLTEETNICNMFTGAHFKIAVDLFTAHNAPIRSSPSASTTTSTTSSSTRKRKSPDRSAAQLLLPWENKQWKDEKTDSKELHCEICMDNKKCIVLEECGHLYLCLECAQKTYKPSSKSIQCSKCRRPSNHFIRTF